MRETTQLSRCLLELALLVAREDRHLESSAFVCLDLGVGASMHLGEVFLVDSAPPVMQLAQLEHSIRHFLRQLRPRRLKQHSLVLVLGFAIVAQRLVAQMMEQRKAVFERCPSPWAQRSFLCSSTWWRLSNQHRMAKTSPMRPSPRCADGELGCGCVRDGGVLQIESRG